MEIELPEDSPQGWTLITASGEVDVTSAHILRDCLSELTRDGSDRLIVDLDSVDFLDSTGLGVLMDAADDARSSGGELRLVCTEARLLDVIATADPDTVLPIADSVDAATEAAGRP